jgi:glycosyltransferase involved in cell wall biosynthesis
VTSGLARQAEDLLGVQQTMVIQNGSDPEMFSRSAYAPSERVGDDGKLQIVSIGSTPNSYHDIPLIEALCRIIDRRRLPMEVHLFGKSAELCSGDVPHSLHVHGPASYLEMPRVLAQMDVGLALYNIPLDLGSPLKLFDYLASGCVPVCSGGQAVDEVLRNDDCGLVRDGWTPESLSEALLALHKNRARLERMRTLGRTLIEREYNWRCVALKTEAILEALVERRRGAPVQ